jgi:hypothetical protein
MTLSPTRAIKAAALMLVGVLMAGCPTGDDMAHAASASRTETIQYPWQGTDDEIVVNLAIGSLHHSMMNWLTTERGIHAETLLVSMGAIAGFAAQSAVLERIKKRDISGVDKSLEGDALGRFLQESNLAVVVTAKSGDIYYFGDLINGYLVQQKTTVNYSLYAILAGGAITAGVKPNELPDVIPMFAHASKTVGTADYGILHPPGNLVPQMTPRQALDRFWPRVKFIFERTDGQRVVTPAKGRNVRPEYWPLITALVARKFLLMAKDTIDPRTGLALMMESAIAMSKVDPKTVPQTEPASAQ